MAPKDVIFNGAKFVPNNYSAILNKDEAPSELHFVQDFLAHSEIGYALTQPQAISGKQVLEFWKTGIYDDGGETGSPSIIFSSGEDEYMVTVTTVRHALHLPENCTYNSAPGESVLQNMMASLGYEKSLSKLGQLKRPYIRREWSFFFDCITKTFANKCSNFDAIPIMSQQIGYALLNQTHFDYASAVLGYIGDRMKEDANVVYFARFCQLIYSYCCPDKPQVFSDLMEPFKLHKRAFADLLSADNKKEVLRPLQIPQSVKQFLVNTIPDTYTTIFLDVAPS